MLGGRDLGCMEPFYEETLDTKGIRLPFPKETLRKLRALPLVTEDRYSHQEEAHHRAGSTGTFPNYLPTYNRTWMRFQHKGSHRKAVAWWGI